MITPRVVSIESGRAQIAFDSRRTDEPSPYWCSWTALSEDGAVVDSGVFQIAGASGPGCVLQCDPRTRAIRFADIPNFTPFPTALYRGQRALGAWQLSANVIMGVGERITFRIPSDSDGKYIASVQVTQGGRIDARLQIENPWSCLHVVKEVRGRQSVVEDIELTHLDSNQRWLVFFESSKAEHPVGLTGERRRLVFGDTAVSWSYFTCWPMLV